MDSQTTLTRNNSVLLIRHGETSWSLTGRFAGHTDIPLTGAGEIAAMQARKYFTAHSITRVMVSPLQRAQRTAELLGFKDAIADPRLLERHYGQFEGMTTAQIRAQHPGWDIWKDPIPQGEPLFMMAQRVDSVIVDIQSTQVPLTLIVAHAHWIRLFTARWLKLEPECARLFRLSTLGLVHLGWERENPVIHQWNV